MKKSLLSLVVLSTIASSAMAGSKECKMELAKTDDGKASVIAHTLTISDDGTFSDGSTSGKWTTLQLTKKERDGLTQSANSATGDQSAGSQNAILKSFAAAAKDSEVRLMAEESGDHPTLYVTKDNNIYTLDMKYQLLQQGTCTQK